MTSDSKKRVERDEKRVEGTRYMTEPVLPWYWGHNPAAMHITCQLREQKEDRDVQNGPEMTTHICTRTAFMYLRTSAVFAKGVTGPASIDEL